MQTAIPCSVMRGGTSRGLYFRADDLPKDIEARNAVLQATVGSPDPRQIDGMGGAHPLTSKVAIVKASERPDADVDYLFLQIGVNDGLVSDGQNCGNLLAGVGPFAIDNGWVAPHDPVTDVRIYMVNTQSLAVARICTPKGQVTYSGRERIDGVPGTAAPVRLNFVDTAGSSCGALLPTGAVADTLDGIEVTCVDNGMPVVMMRAADFGKSGYESPDALEADRELTARIESIRLAMGQRVNLGDVANKTVPKMCLIAPPRDGGAICTRTFIPHRVHNAIGVLGAVSVATACVIAGTVAHRVVGRTPGGVAQPIRVEHPSGYLSVEVIVDEIKGAPVVTRAALLRTARLLMRGEVFIPRSVWARS